MATPQKTFDTCDVHSDPAPSPNFTESSCVHHLFDIECIKKKKENTKQIVELLQSDLAEFEDAEFHFDRHEPTRADDAVTDPYSINFEPRTVAETTALINKIEDDLMERNIDATGDLEELRVILIERLEIEHHLKELQLSFKLCGSHVDAFVESHKLIPCIVHLEQRVGLKMLTLTCAEGLNSFVTVDTSNFGMPDSPSMWNFPRSVQ
jgi:hypothetical protein